MNTKKLDNITTQYRKFNVNQALTEGQLNEFIDYFEDQDRLSRTLTVGTGLACGFETSSAAAALAPIKKPSELGKAATDGDILPELPQQDNFDSISITQGVAITTDGDLITLRRPIVQKSEMTVDFLYEKYRYYRDFTNPREYSFFTNPLHPIVELLTKAQYDLLMEDVEDGEDSGMRPIDYNELGDKSLVLYLDTYSNEGSPCQDADCLSQGAEQVSNLMVLMVNTADAGRISERDSIYQLHKGYETLQLPDIEVKRVMPDAAIDTAGKLKTRFQNAVTDNNTVSNLTDGFSKIALKFGITATYPGYGTSLGAKLDSILNPIPVNATDFQYRYDFLKDLVDTYNEIKGLLFSLKVECCPKINSFPKHILLGKIGTTSGVGDDNGYRHDFYNSPANTTADDNYEMAVSLINRFIQKVTGFRTFTGPIVITPSVMGENLGQGAIPFYYDVNDTLLQEWNYTKTKSGRSRFNLSYHKANLDSAPFVQNPLLYNLDDFNFYLTEGHIGLPYKTALQNYNDLRAQFNLDFDVFAIVLDKSGTTGGTTPTTSSPAETVVSIKKLREQLLGISSDISKQTASGETLQVISDLDNQLRLLNGVSYAPSETGVSVLKQNAKDDDVVSELLSDFIDRIKGIEHLGGVQRGGSLLLFYESEQNNKVIADFSLPYLCCSKKDPVFLVLPASHLCENDAEIPMTIIPLDGEVKAFVNGTAITGAIRQNGGQNFFNPGAVPANYHGQAINFTVNEDPVDSKITVHTQPNVNIAVGEVVYGEDMTHPTASIQFTVTGNSPADLDDLTYYWNFDDGKTSTGTATVVNHTYTLVAGEEDVYTPVLTVTNANGCSTQYTVPPITLKLIINKNTKIRIYFDASGSMATTLAPLQVMKSNTLKSRLLPLYGNDEQAYNANVQVISYTDERTFNVLNLLGDTPSGNVIALVFQDEADSVYHSRSFTTPTAAFNADIAAFRARLANKFGTNNPNYYRGVVFQVQGDEVYANFLKAVENGTGNYNTVHGLSDRNEVIFRYNLDDGNTTTPNYYLDKIVLALQNLGYNIP